MPFRRTRRRRRVTRRRPTAMRAVRRLAKFVDTELHQQIAFFTEVGILGGVESFTPLTLIAQGDDDINRTGLQVALRSIRIKFNATRGNADTVLRVILFVDKQSNGGTPLIGQVLQLTGSIPSKIVSPVSNDFKRRFTFLSDRTHQISLGRGEHVLFTISRKLTNKVRYDGPGAAIADVVSGMLWLLLLSDGAGGAQSPSVSMASRVWYAP